MDIPLSPIKMHVLTSLTIINGPKIRFSWKLGFWTLWAYKPHLTVQNGPRPHRIQNVVHFPRFKNLFWFYVENTADKTSKVKNYHDGQYFIEAANFLEALASLDLAMSVTHSESLRVWASEILRVTLWQSSFILSLFYSINHLIIQPIKQ